MLRNKIFAGCLLLLLATSPVYAGQYDEATFNFGLEISVINNTSYNNGANATISAFKASPSDSKLAIEKNEPGINAFLGARFNETWGAQVGFSFIETAGANVQNGQRATNKISNVFIDLLGFINVAKQVDMMGLVGYGMLKSNPSVTNTYIYNQESLTKRKLGIRLGGGAQYNFSGNWSSRAMLIYQKGNPVFLKTLYSLSIGLLYTFS